MNDRDIFWWMILIVAVAAIIWRNGPSLESWLCWLFTAHRESYIKKDEWAHVMGDPIDLTTGDVGRQLYEMRKGLESTIAWMETKDKDDAGLSRRLSVIEEQLPTLTAAISDLRAADDLKSAHIAKLAELVAGVRADLAEKERPAAPPRPARNWSGVLREAAEAQRGILQDKI
jgi:hypothetical protein